MVLVGIYTMLDANVGKIKIQNYTLTHVKLLFFLVIAFNVLFIYFS